MRELDDIIESLRKNHYFEPGMDIQLYRQEELTKIEENRMREKNPINLKYPGNGLLRRDRKRDKFRKLRNFLPRNPGRPRTGLEDLKDKKDFIEWFDQKYDFPDGVYCSFKGKGRGFQWFFLFEIKHGSISPNSWKKKSNGKARDRASKYMTFPYYFKERKKWNV